MGILAKKWEKTVVMPEPIHAQKRDGAARATMMTANVEVKSECSPKKEASSNEAKRDGS